jgi:NAD(P)H dehydrogenase (quinone)
VLVLAHAHLGIQLAARNQHVLDAAAQAGVRQVLYTSVLNPSLTSTFQASPSHLLTEEALQASGLDYTILRNTLYLDNLPAQVGNAAVATGKVYAAAGDGRASYGLRTEMGEILANVLILLPVPLTPTATSPRP